MSKQQYLSDRIKELAALLRADPNDSNKVPAKDVEYVSPQELQKLICMLRPGNANEHANAVRLRLRKTILNHPSGGVEGPLILSKFDKSCENVRKLNPHILNPFLVFLQPISFYEGSNNSQTKYAFQNNIFQTEQQFEQDHKTLPALNNKPATFVKSLPVENNPPPTTIPPVSTNSALLASHWVDPEVERKLLVDIVYILQGVTGKYIKYDTRSESYLIDPALQLSTTIRDMVLCICELGWLFNRINDFLKRIFQSDGPNTSSTTTANSSNSNSYSPMMVNGSNVSKGLILQAFGYALQEQLHDYYRLLAILEQELLKTNNQMDSPSLFNVPSNPRDQTFQSKYSSNNSTTSPPPPSTTTTTLNYGLTLMRLKTWLQEPIERMCLLARLVDSVQHLSGGALISRLYAHSKHGDLLSLSLVQRILDSVCHPIYAMLNRWILHGELNDPYNEFFIAKNMQFIITNVTDNFWENSYYLKTNLLPNFITQSMAEKLLIIGKSIDFMKLCLQRLPTGTTTAVVTSNKGKKGTKDHNHTISGIRKSYRQLNKMKQLTTYGRVVDNVVDEEEEDEEEVVEEEEGGDNKVVTAISTPQDIVHAIAIVLHKYYTTSSSSQQQKEKLSIEEMLHSFLAQYHIHTNNNTANNTANNTNNNTSTCCTPTTQLLFASCMNELSTMIDYQLVTLLKTKFSLRSHLLALKKFLLLGQGDFIICLMDNIGPELKNRANVLYRHNLLSLLEGSLRSSNAQYESNDILERISIRLLENKPGDTGWEIFSLDYLIDFPLNVIVHTQAMQSYRIAFHMLWKLKRVEWSLSITWKQFLSFAHTYHDYFHYATRISRHHTASNPSNPSTQQNGSIFATILSQTNANNTSNHIANHPTTSVYQFSIELRSIFHYCNLNRAHMMHIVNNLCAFLMFEVMETTWIQLEHQLNTAKSLNEIITAHDTYLQTILERSLLSNIHETLTLQLQTLLQIILRFCQLEETLVADAMACITRHKMFSKDRPTTNTTSSNANTNGNDDESVASNMTGIASAATASARNKPTTKTMPTTGNNGNSKSGKGMFNPTAPIDGIPTIMISRITETVREYHTQFEIFMNMLKQEGEKFGEIVRFLAFRLDFNSYHENQKSSAAGSAAAVHIPSMDKPPTSSTSSNKQRTGTATTNGTTSSAERDALLAKYTSKVGISAASLTSATNVTSSSNRMYRSSLTSNNTNNTAAGTTGSASRSPSSSTSMKFTNNLASSSTDSIGTHHSVA